MREARKAHGVVIEPLVVDVDLVPRALRGTTGELLAQFPHCVGELISNAAISTWISHDTSEVCTPLVTSETHDAVSVVPLLVVAGELLRTREPARKGRREDCVPSRVNVRHLAGSARIVIRVGHIPLVDKQLGTATDLGILACRIEDAHLKVDRLATGHAIERLDGTEPGI